MTPDECLSAAWTYCAPGRNQGVFPVGFWPDVARVAMEMFAQQTATPTLTFRATRCDRGDYPERTKITSKKLKGLDLSKLEISI